MAVDDSIKAIVLQRADKLSWGLPLHQTLKGNSHEIKKHL